MMFDKTPLRLADTHRAESQDKKRENQREQAKKMIKMQGKDVADKGAAPGAVVTVKCDYRAVSFTIGIVGVVYEVSTFGQRLREFYLLVKGRVRGGYQRISMLLGTVQMMRPTSLLNYRRYVRQYWWGHTITTIVHRNAQFNKRTN